MKVLISKNIFMPALLLSLSGHILLALLVNVVVVPPHQGLTKFGRIYFLGSILEETAFRKGQPEKPAYGPAPYKGLLARDNVAGLLVDYIIKKKKETVKLPRDLIDPEIRKDILWTTQTIELPASSYLSEPVAYVTAQAKIEGSLSKRRLLYRPEIPERPEWLDKREGSFKVLLKLGVSSEGVVEAATVLNSSGWPALDILILSHVRSWRFVPKVTTDKSDELDYGVVSVKFE